MCSRSFLVKDGWQEIQNDCLIIWSESLRSPSVMYLVFLYAGCLVIFPANIGRVSMPFDSRKRNNVPLSPFVVSGKANQQTSAFGIVWGKIKSSYWLNSLYIKSKCFFLKDLIFSICFNWTRPIAA